jgi:NAD(P)-dependent dehydrogenase (short-subunit alcohol dehydrogenase family)
MSKVLITGGSRGIGAAAVELFAQRGDTVWFLYEKNHEAAQADLEPRFYYRRENHEIYEVLALPRQNMNHSDKRKSNNHTNPNTLLENHY